MKHTLWGRLQLSTLFLIFCIYSWNCLTNPVSGQDEGILLLYPSLISENIFPIKDFSVTYPPGNYFLLSFIYNIFGSNVIVERFVGSLYVLLVLAASYMLGTTQSKYVAILSTTSSLVSLILFQSIGPAYAFFISSANLLFLTYLNIRLLENKKPNIFLRICIGLSSATLFYFRQDYALIGFVVSVHFLFFEKSAKNFAIYFASFFVSLLPLLYLLIEAGFQNSINDLILNVLRISPGRVIPLKISIILVAMISLAAIDFLVSLYLIINKKNVPRKTVYVSIALSFITLLSMPSAFQRSDVHHLAYVLATVFPVTIVNISNFLNFIKGSRIYSYVDRNIKIYSSIFYMLLFFFFIWSLTNLPKYKTQLVYSRDHDRFIYLEEHKAANVNSIIARISSINTHNCQIFVGPEDLSRTIYNYTYIYFLLPNCKPTTTFLELNPGVANRANSGLPDHIAQAHILVLTTEFKSWIEPNLSGVSGDPISNKVVSNFFLEDSVYGDLHLMKRLF